MPVGRSESHHERERDDGHNQTGADEIACLEGLCPIGDHVLRRVNHQDEPKAHHKLKHHGHADDIDPWRTNTLQNCDHDRDHRRRYGFIEKAFGRTITWLEWFIAAAPFGILMCIALYFVMTLMMPPEVKEVPGGREATRKALADLGPMKTSEKKLLAISLTLLAFWATEGVLHRFDTSTTTITAVALMFLPGIGIMTWKDAQPRIPWGTVILFGIGISLGTALLQTRGAVWLADLVVAEFGLKQANVMFILGVMTLFLIVIHLGFASATALIATMFCAAAVLIPTFQMLAV